MRFTVSVLGTEVFSTSTDQPATEASTDHDNNCSQVELAGDVPGGVPHPGHPVAGRVVSAVPAFGAPLGVRESQCLHLIASGMSNKEIAAVMGIAPFTVSAHVRVLLRKLGATNRTHAVALAWRRGWLDLSRCAS